MPKNLHDVDICIIGAGAGGLSIASGAAQLGRSVVLFEAEEMGGDCLNYGCVPSKALISAAKYAHAQTAGKKFGIKPVTPKVDWSAVKSHISGVIETIAPVDSQERFEGMGVTVIRERARFKDGKTVESATFEVTAKRFIVATGSRASVPPIPGLDKVDYLTNETIFSADILPTHLLIIGAGPIGLELGQSFRRLGSKVSIVDIAPPLGQSEPEHAKALAKCLEEEGVEFHAPVTTKKITQTKSGITMHLEGGKKLKGSHLLVAAGRAPVVNELNLEAAGVEYTRRGITTDDCLRTSNKKIFAVGDVAAGRGGLTHAAGFHAGAIIKSFYFLPPPFNRWKGRATTDRMPAAIYTSPELASIGLTEAAAREAGHKLKVLHFEFEENDRAIAERRTEGNVKIIATTKGKILGASILGESAGDLIQLISLAMTNGVKISGLAQFISPYPTRAEAVKRAASSFYTETVFSDKTRKLAGFLTKLH
ncbi:MAG: FAD-dependent oxidoreductase [Hellea sp.]|nr:FAD-dependent oxidoreductase [Hellea sp.]